MIYAVIPLSIRKDLDERLEKIDENFFRIDEPRIYFLSYKGTSVELAKAVGFRNDKQDTGLVLRVTTYHGYAQKRLWEWLEVHQNGE